MPHWKKQADKVDAGTDHEIIIAVKQLGLDKLAHQVELVSTPGTSHYGKHWTFEEVGEAVRNDAAIAAVKGLMAKYPDVRLKGMTPNGTLTLITCDDCNA